MVSDVMNPDLLKSIEGKKRELDSFRPFPAEIVRKLEEQFTVEWTYNSNATSKLCSYGIEYLSYLARTGRLQAIKIRRNWMTTREALSEYTGKVKKI
jgi:hypothetical protein